MGNSSWSVPILSVSLSVIATFFINIFMFNKNKNAIEDIERRKEKYKLSDDLYSIRYILSNGYQATSQEVTQFNKLINRIPYVFAENNDIVKDYENLRDDILSQRSTSTDERLVNLIQKICQRSEFARKMDAREIRNTFYYPQPPSGGQ